MNVNVQMLAFGDPGETRTVTVPDNEWTTDTNKNLELVFHYGQNDFQPQNHPSVSVGDIIELDNVRWLVRPFGFLGLTPEQFSEYNTLLRRDRQFHYLIEQGSF